MKVSYCKGGRAKGQERVEKVVDIYESAETVTGHRVNPSRKPQGAQTRKRPQTTKRNLYKPAAFILGLLCFLLLVGISVLLMLYLSISSKLKQCQATIQNQTQEKQKQNYTGWHEFRLSHFYYASTETKNWTESREDCKKRGGDLAIINSKQKQDMIRNMTIHGDSWIGLQTTTTMTNTWKQNWQWVDGSEPQYSAWKKEIPQKPEAGLKAYTDQQGLWMYNKTGLKHWICERKNVGWYL